MSFSELVNNEPELAIIYIRIVNQTGDYEGTVKCNWPKFFSIRLVSKG